MIRVNYQVGQSVHINTTMNEARGIVSQEIVTDNIDAVSTLHLDANSALTPKKLRELADLLDGPRAGATAEHIYGDECSDEQELSARAMQEIHRDTLGDIVCRKCYKILEPEQTCPNCYVPKLNVYRGFDGPISKRYDKSVIPF